MTTVTMNFSIDNELKEQAEDLFSELGMDLSTALTIFLRQAVLEQQIPFMITRNVPNAVTLSAMEKAEHDEDMHGPYDDIVSLMNDLSV